MKFQFFLYLLIIITSVVFSQEKTTVAILETPEKTHSEIQHYLINEFQKIDSIKVFSKSEIDSTYHLYKIDSTQHNQLFSVAIGKIINADYLIQTKVLENNNYTEAIISVFDVLTKKYVYQYNIELKPNNYTFAVDSLLVNFKKYAFEKGFCLYPELYQNNIGENNKYIDCLNKNIPSKYILIAKSDEPEAILWFDNKKVGKLPYLLSDIDFGSHSISVRNIKYDLSYQSSLNYYTSDVYNLFVNLTPVLLKIDGKPQEAQIYLDRENIGIPPFKNYVINNSNHELLIKQNGYYNKEMSFTINQTKAYKINFALEPKSKMNALLFSTLFPGVGQFYRDDYIQGILFTGIEVLSLTSAISYNTKMHDAKDDYASMQTTYRTISQVVDIKQYEREITSKYKEIENLEKMRNIFIGVSVGVWALNIVEALIWKEKPAFMENIKVSVHKNKYPNDLSSQISINYPLK